MKTLAFSIVQAILSVIFPQQVADALADFIPNPEEIVGKALPAEQLQADFSPVAKINFPADQTSDLPLPQPPPLLTPPPPAEVEVKKVVPPKSLGEQALDFALSKKGSDYVWGGNGPDVFDCSGLTKWAYAQVGVVLNRIAIDQASNGYAVDTPALGDIVVLNGGSHVGLYAGNGMILNAPTFGDVVKLSPMSDFSIYAIRRI